MYLWKCTCADCGREFDWYDNYPPLECVKCGSVGVWKSKINLKEGRMIK